STEPPAAWSSRASAESEAAGHLTLGEDDEVVLEGPDRGGGAAPHAGLLVDVLDVVPDGPGGDAEPRGDRLIRLAAHDDPQDWQLALGQPGRQLANTLARAVPGGIEDGVDRARVEPPLVHLALQLRLCGCCVERRPVWAGLAHRAVAVGDGQNPRALT